MTKCEIPGGMVPVFCQAMLLIRAPYSLVQIKIGVNSLRELLLGFYLRPFDLNRPNFDGSSWGISYRFFGDEPHQCS